MNNTTGAWTRAAVVCLAALPCAAQREPVLQQIRLPHNYYFRELYLPQLTSGPSSLCWSPDGRELIVSMQGSLWRHRLGTREALQLTDGPGYDYQPDWSPDGRSVVYVSYRDDQLALMLLDLTTRTSHALIADGSVNLEPRFAPDGQRLAFVSTSYEGRFHIFATSLADGRIGTPERITPDVNAGLPRYYYGPFDHYLSPSWSPDGQELLFVSNRGKVWGTGGLWRMRAMAGSPLVAVHDEETSWKARPDWAPSGRRVVLSSYLGRAWHQLWLTTADGGSAFPLGYREQDVTSPRWSRDGRRIAYITNDEGDLRAEIQDIPGGAQARVGLYDRRYLRPTGRLRVQLTDEHNRSLPGRLSVTGSDGRSYAPDDAWRHADDAFDRRERRFEYAYFHSRGESVLTVPAGTYTLEALRGLEYRPARSEARVEANAEREIQLALTRLDDLPARGVWSGDLHVHMNYGGTYRNEPVRLRRQAEAEDVHVLQNLIVNKEQRIPDAIYHPGLDEATGRETLIAHGQEFHTSFWGHTGLLGLKRLLLPDYAGYVATAAASLVPTNTDVARDVRAQGGLFGYVHPFDTLPDPARVEERLTHALPVDVALGLVDYYEVVGFSDHLATAQVWYRLLNCGFRLPAGAGTDAMANYASLRGPVGLNRVFVKSGELRHTDWLAALAAGRSFATNGPLVELLVNGKPPGDELALPSGRQQLDVRARLRSIVPVDHLELVSNGKLVAEVPLTGDRTSIDARLKVSVAESSWLTLRARGERPRHPVLDIYPFATTSPVYVVIGGVPQRSAADARHFIAWIDRLLSEAELHAGYNDDHEKRSVLSTLHQAREVFVRQARPVR